MFLYLAGVFKINVNYVNESGFTPIISNANARNNCFLPNQMMHPHVFTFMNLCINSMFCSCVFKQFAYYPSSPPHLPNEESENWKTASPFLDNLF